SSPIQEKFPIVRNHGYLIFTPGFINTPVPIFAPNNLRIKILSFDDGFHLFTIINKFMKYQIRILILFPGWNQLLVY
ncbi:MAG: hypothetical protein K2H22_00425, partial [Muribaculaceae bacterium]|nr:hypothetical protein [Muribaculaceae bacterium]